MADTTQRSRTTATSADATCDVCDTPVEVTRAQARILRQFFGSLLCPECGDIFDYADAWDELTTEVAQAVEDGYGQQDTV